MGEDGRTSFSGAAQDVPIVPYGFRTALAGRPVLPEKLLESTPARASRAAFTGTLACVLVAEFLGG